MEKPDTQKEEHGKTIRGRRHYKFKFEYRGKYGLVNQCHYDDNGTEDWRGKEVSTWYRFGGDTLEDCKKDFQRLVDGLIDELEQPGEPKNDSNTLVKVEFFSESNDG